MDKYSNYQIESISTEMSSGKSEKGSGEKKAFQSVRPSLTRSLFLKRGVLLQQSEFERNKKKSYFLVAYFTLL